MGSLGGWEILIILGVLVVLFGARRLPDMARSIGQSARVFKGEMKGLREDEKAPEQTPRTDTPVTPVNQVNQADEAGPAKRPETPGPTTP